MEKQIIKGKCNIHGKDVFYLYSKTIQAFVCKDCIEDELYRDDICLELRKTYPEQFA